MANYTPHRDAAFELSNQEAACYYPWRWNGIPDGTTWDCARPIPDEYNSDHIYYYYFESEGTSEIFEFIESASWNYGDNSGSLNASAHSLSVENVLEAVNQFIAVC